jgi:hypothetical protein
MPLENWVQHHAVAGFFYDWQTLIAGVFAVLAAAGTIWATIKSASREIDASQAQTVVAQRQIETTLRLERIRAAREGYAFSALLEAATGQVLVEAAEAKELWTTSGVLAVTAVRQCFKKSAFSEIRAACVRQGGHLTAEFLDLECEIDSFGSSQVEIDDGRGGRLRVCPETLCGIA